MSLRASDARDRNIQQLQSKRAERDQVIGEWSVASRMAVKNRQAYRVIRDYCLLQKRRPRKPELHRAAKLFELPCCRHQPEPGRSHSRDNPLRYFLCGPVRILWPTGTGGIFADFAVLRARFRR